MSYTTFLFLFLVFCLNPFFATESARADSTDVVKLRVMSYNIRYDTPKDTAAQSWPNRRDKVASMIRFYHPDVVGTQEGKIHQLMDLESRLSGYDWIGVGRRSGGDEFTAILYRTQRLTLLEHGTFWLSRTPRVPESKSWGSSLPRIATWARFRDEISEDTLFVLNTHFDHESAEARANSARLIADTLGQLRQSKRVVVTGDFNSIPESRPYTILTHSKDSTSSSLLRDAMRVSVRPHHGPVSTSNSFEPRVQPNNRIDYVFVGAGFKVLRHAHLSARWGGQFPSDHLPVLVELLTGQ